MTETSHIFAIDDEIVMLRDSARRFLAQKWPADRAVALSQQADALRALWRGIAEQGWLGLGAEDDACVRTASVLLEELGGAGCPAPLLDTIVANMILRRAGEAFATLRGSIERGEAVVACVLDSDERGFTSTGEGNTAKLSGNAAFVDGSSIATHFLVVTGQKNAIALVAANAAGVAVTPTPGFSVPPLAEIVFADAPAVTGTCDWDKQAIASLMRLGLAARAFGAARRGFDLITDYAKVRVQFGKKIGSYQAIQHKLANCLINLDIARLALLRAAGAFDRATPDWLYAANVAFSVASPALRQVCLETHHAFGGISFWEEHEMPRHFRRIHADLARSGGVHAAREVIADFLFDGAA